MQIPPKGALALTVEALASEQPRRLRVIQRPAGEVRALTARALTEGAEPHSPTYATWGVSGRCEAPLTVRHAGYGHLTHNAHTGRSAWGWEAMRDLDVEVPCRKCGPCLRARAYLWGTRAVREWTAGLIQGRRTWFGSLTFEPHERALAIARVARKLAPEVWEAAPPASHSQWMDELHSALLARRRPAGAGGDARPWAGFNGLSHVDRFRLLADDLGGHCTRFLKRLRKGNAAAKYSPAVFRYLLTVEPHKDWMPHFHVLIHEASDDEIPWRTLNGQWKAGFDTFKLVESEKGAFYAAKYLSKYSVARVRASTRYGEDLAVTPRPQA